MDLDDRQLDLLEGEGLAPERVVLGHADNGEDHDPMRDIHVAKRGAFVGMDMIGYDTEKLVPGGPAPLWARPRKERLRQILDFLDAGYVTQCAVSADANCHPLGWNSPPHSMAELLRYFVPDLRSEGADDAVIEQLLVANPARVLTIDETSNEGAAR